MDTNKKIDSLPWWRKLVTCWSRRKAWGIARAYNTVALDLLGRTATWDHGDDLRKLGDRKWAELYGFPPGEIPEHVEWRPRAERAERELGWERERRRQLEHQIELLKKTSRALRGAQRA